MPILSANWRQLGHLVVVYADATLPAWRLVGFWKDGLAKRLNVLALAALIGAIWLAANYPVFVTGVEGEGKKVLVKGEDATGQEKVVAIQRVDPITTGAAIRFCAIWTRLALSLFVQSLVIVAFMVDLRDVVSHTQPGTCARFLYTDVISKNISITSCLVLVMAGYITRMGLFALAALLGLEAANQISVVSSGISVFAYADMPCFPEGLWPKVEIVLLDPMGPGHVGVGGCWESEAFVLVFKSMHALAVMFFVSCFYLIITSLSVWASKNGCPQGGKT